MTKDFWDKLGITGTFISVILTAFIGIHVSKLSNNIEGFKNSMNENKMINDLVKDLTIDSSSTLKSDFALLALERYLRNTNEEGILRAQDKEMLVGFAQSLILDRNNFHILDSEKRNRFEIPSDFLKRYDTLKWNSIVSNIGSKNKTSNYPKSTTSITDSSLPLTAPVSQVTDTKQTDLISAILKKMVYIQYSNKGEKKEIEGIQQNFKNKDWVAPGIEYVKGRYSNIIKYFHDEDREIAIEAKNLLGNNFKIYHIKDPKYKKVVPQGQIEIWISTIKE